MNYHQVGYIRPAAIGVRWSPFLSVGVTLSEKETGGNVSYGFVESNNRTLLVAIAAFDFFVLLLSTSARRAVRVQTSFLTKLPMTVCKRM